MSDTEALKQARAAAQQAAVMVDGLVSGIQGLAVALGLGAGATRAEMLEEIERLREFERRSRGDA